MKETTAALTGDILSAQSYIQEYFPTGVFYCIFVIIKALQGWKWWKLAGPSSQVEAASWSQLDCCSSQDPYYLCCAQITWILFPFKIKLNNTAT